MVDATHIQSGSPVSVKPLSGNFFPETRSCVLSGSKPHHDDNEGDPTEHVLPTGADIWGFPTLILSLNTMWKWMNYWTRNYLQKDWKTGSHCVLPMTWFLGRPGVSCLIRDTVNTPQEQMNIAKATKCLSALQHSRDTFFFFLKSWGIIYLIWKRKTWCVIMITFKRQK